MKQAGLWGAVLLLSCAARAEQGIEPLKAAALELTAHALDLERRVGDTAAGRLSLYLGTPATEYTITEASVAIDGAEVLRQSFTADEARALTPELLYRLGRFERAAGPHHLELRVGTRDAAGAARDFSAALDEADDGDTTVVASLRGGSWFSAPALRLARVRDTAGVEDALLRHTRFLSRGNEYLQAAAELRQARMQGGARLDPALFDALAAYGVLAQARDLLPALNSDAAEAARQNLAERYYEQGEWSEAWNALGERPPRARAARPAWQDLQARILLAQGRAGEAAAVLREIDNRADLASYLRYYNLGAALIADGNVGQGLTVLDRVGSVVSDDAAMRALSDRANLALGSYFLGTGQGACAIAALGRVHADGPYSARATLQLGWAWLAPRGTPQRQAALGDERIVGAPPETAPAAYSPHDQNLYQRYTPDAFADIAFEPGRASRLRRALALWNGLAAQQPRSEPGLEAALASALELQRGGAGAAARAGYDGAIANLEHGIADIDQARHYVESARLDTELLEPPPQAGFDRALHALPPLPAAGNLREALAGAAFQRGLAAFRDLRVTARELDRTTQSLESSGQAHCAESTGAACGEVQDLLAQFRSLTPALAAAAEMQRQDLRRQLLEALAQQDQHLAGLLRGARFELARLYDDGAPGPP